jgi:hypothetical protein
LWLVVVFTLSLPAVTVRFYASDEIEYFAYLRSMWFDGDLSFDNEYRYFYERGLAEGTHENPGRPRYGARFYETFLAGTTATGLRNNFAPIGSAILWAPMYLVADAGVRIARVFGSDVPADGYSTPYIAAAVYGSAFYGFMAVLLSTFVASRFITGEMGSGANALAGRAALIIWIGTPLLFYMYLAPGFSHACSAFAVAMFVFVWLEVRRDWSLGGVAALGAAAGLMGMVREQDLFIALGPAVDYLVTSSRVLSVGTIVLRGLTGILTCVIVFLPQLISYQILYGRPSPSPTVERKMTWTSPHAWLVLASPDNGLFFWTPIALIALAGLLWLAMRSWIGLMCLLMVLTQIYVGGALDTWAGAGSFGQRRLIGLTVFFVIGLTAILALPRRPWLRTAINAFAALAVWWNLGLMAQFGTAMMSRQHLDPARNAYNNFVTVPLRLPNLMYRYLFSRESFYQDRASY